MQVSSYFASFLLHALLVLMALLWPSKPPMDLTRTVYQVSLVDGAPGGELLPSPVLGKQGDPSTKAKAEVLPPSQPAAAQLNAAPAPADVKAPEAPQKPPEVPRPESVPKPVPQPPKPDAEPVSPTKVDKPEPPKPEPAKPEPAKPEPAKPEPAKPEPPKPQPPKPEPVKPEPAKPEPPKAAKAPEAPKPAESPKVSPEDALKNALADAQKQAGKERQGQSQAPRSGSAALSSALADMQRQSRRQGTGGGGGGEGDGPGGGGINDVYAGLVIMAVQPQWSTTTFSSRQNLVVLVRIRLDPDGGVLECKVERSSGNTAFDGSAVNAVNRTRILPKPPTPEQQDLLVTFNSQDMGR